MGSAQHQGCTGITPSTVCNDSQHSWLLNRYRHCFLATSILWWFVTVAIFLWKLSLLPQRKVTALWAGLWNLCQHIYRQKPGSGFSFSHCWLYHIRLPHLYSLLSSLSVSQESEGQFGEWEFSGHCSSWVSPNTTVGERPSEIQPRVRHTAAPLPAVMHHSLLLPLTILTLLECP